MFTEEFQNMSGAAKNKAAYLKCNPRGYFMLSMLAGAFIGFGILLSFTVGGMLSGQPYAKLAMGAVFGIALSLVVMAGAELFTGNNLVMAAGAFTGVASWGDTVRLWSVCWLGNLAGSILLAVVFWGSGLATGATGEFIADSAAVKMSLPVVQLFLRGMLCNMLVCLAVWCGFRCKSESGKLMMIFWCLLVFFTCGFEHSIANMTLLTVALLVPHSAAVGIGGYCYNLAVATLGNLAGGLLFVAVPYFLATQKGDLDRIHK